MLTLFLSVFAPFGVGRPFGCGRAVVGAGVGGPRCIDGALRLLLGVVGMDGTPVTDRTDEPPPGVVGGGMLPVLFLDFATGSAGNAMFGGPFEGRDGLGSVVAILCSGFALLPIFVRLLVRSKTKNKQLRTENQ